MIFYRLLLIAAILFLLAPPATQGARAFQAQPGGPARKATFSTPEQIQEDIQAVPCKSNAERLAGVKALFMKMGAAASDIPSKR